MASKGGELNDPLHAFNSFFKGTAKVVMINNQSEITIGSQTLVISSPEIVGVQARSSS